MPPAALRVLLWGINPDTDSRFIKNGNSVVDALLSHYLPDSATFQHVVGAGSNAMATDQSCYALVAYDRFINGQTDLYDYSNVVFDAPVPKEMAATLSLPAECAEGDSFNGVISINKWDNEAGYKLIYNDGTNTIKFKYSAEITAKTGIATYVALVDETIAMENFVSESNFSMPGGNAAALTFGDTNGDGVINAQDALAAVDTWLRKGEEPTDDEILIMNVNGDSRINTFDALGIVEAFVNETDYIVVTKAATITENQ